MPNVQAFRFEDDGETPNNPHLPLVVYRAAVKLAGEHDPAAPFERAFAKHGWGDGWRNGIYPFLHFHTATHEVLGIARGRATVEFGGAKGQALTVEAAMSSCCRPAPAIGGSRRAAIFWSSAPIRATLHSTRSGRARSITRRRWPRSPRCRCRRWIRSMAARDRS